MYFLSQADVHKTYSIIGETLFKQDFNTAYNSKLDNMHTTIYSVRECIQGTNKM